MTLRYINSIRQKTASPSSYFAAKSSVRSLPRRGARKRGPSNPNLPFGLEKECRMILRTQSSSGWLKRECSSFSNRPPRLSKTKAKNTPISTMRHSPAPHVTPMQAVSQAQAAVVSPWTCLPSLVRIITPAPKNPMPVKMPCMTRPAALSPDYWKPPKQPQPNRALPAQEPHAGRLTVQVAVEP